MTDTKAVLRRLAGQAGPMTYTDLTRCDIELVQLMALNLSYKEMAERLGLAMQTLKNRRHRLRVKAGVPAGRTRMALVEAVGYDRWPKRLREWRRG